jgi:ABC-2 type transport system ATP-binding protein
MSDVILVEGVCKTYKGGWRTQPKLALDEVSLAVSTGETFGFVGPNGAGKSTLIKILIGVMQSSSGKASLHGRDVADPASRQGLGFVPENPSLQDYLTPYEILLMGLRLHQTRVDDERKHCMEWLARFSLASVADNPVRGFSKGMLQRTALAHALAIKPRLLILDEPLSGLDPIGRRDVVDILSEYRGQGGTIFLTSHVLHDVERLADRFGLIHQGKLLAIQSPNDVVAGEEYVTVRCLGQNPFQGFVAESGGRWVGEVKREELWVKLDALRAAGHQIIEIKPTLSLESAFFRLLEPADRTPAAAS